MSLMKRLGVSSFLAQFLKMVSSYHLRKKAREPIERKRAKKEGALFLQRKIARRDERIAAHGHLCALTFVFLRLERRLPRSLLLALSPDLFQLAHELLRVVLIVLVVVVVVIIIVAIDRVPPARGQGLLLVRGVVVRVGVVSIRIDCRAQRALAGA